MSVLRVVIILEIGCRSPNDHFPLETAVKQTLDDADFGSYVCTIIWLLWFIFKCV